MRGACLTENKNVLYYAIISCDDNTYKPKLYKGICETTFKKPYANHKKSFNAEKKYCIWWSKLCANCRSANLFVSFIRKFKNVIL